MAAVGGSLLSVTIDGRNFAIPADAEANRGLGGFTNEVEANGDGTGRLIKTRVPGMIDGLTVQIDDTRGDHEFLQARANSNNFFPVALSYVSGVTWQGDFQITGDLMHASKATTASVNLNSTGEITRQS